MKARIFYLTKDERRNNPNSWLDIDETIKNIREHGFKKMIIVGGPHPTTSSEEVLKDQNIDLCVIGEGEATLVNIRPPHTCQNLPAI